MVPKSSQHESLAILCLSEMEQHVPDQLLCSSEVGRPHLTVYQPKIRLAWASVQFFQSPLFACYCFWACCFASDAFWIVVWMVFIHSNGFISRFCVQKQVQNMWHMCNLPRRSNNPRTVWESLLLSICPFSDKVCPSIPHLSPKRWVKP